MKKLSLQWRLTLMTAALIAAACLFLYLFISRSAILRINEVENSILEIVPDGQETILIGLDSFGLPADFPLQVREAKKAFLFQSILATIAVIFTGSALTYFLTGRALDPLRKFSSRMENVQAQNLSEPLELPATEDEIARLTRSFNAMLARLDQAFAAQLQFSANAAHELRTPLAVLQTNLEVLQKKQAPTPAEYADTIRMVSEQTGRLSHLVSVLLEMTESQTIERTDRVSFSALTEEVLCDLAQVAEEKGVKLLQIPGDAELTGSDLLLYRAIYNLVENAIKYNRPDGTVTVAVHAENGSAVLSVSDTGIGIRPDYWKSIFDPFIRVDKSRSRAMGGAGLGLALVRSIAEQHAGSVRVVRSSDKGTEIRLTLPAGPASP